MASQHHWDRYAPPTEHTIVALRPDGSAAFLGHNYIQDGTDAQWSRSAPAGISVNGAQALSFTTSGKMVGADRALPVLGFERYIHSAVEYRFFGDYIDSNWRFKVVSPSAAAESLRVINLYMFLWLTYAPGYPYAAPCSPVSNTVMLADPNTPGNTWAVKFLVTASVPITSSATGQFYDPSSFSRAPIPIPPSGFCPAEPRNFDIYGLAPLPGAVVQVSEPIGPYAPLGKPERRFRFENLGSITELDGSNSGATSFSFEKIMAWKETYDGTQGIGIVRGPVASSDAYTLQNNVNYQAAFRISTK